MCEVYNGITFGRQLASYPLLVGIPAKLPTGRFVDITVSGYGQRSLTGIPYPLDINNTDPKLIYYLPGIGKKRARTIIGKRPFIDQKDLYDKVEGIKETLPYIEFRD
jgi:radical SAM superfamily enzyme with C-terminal helix-hairpin-helix motif